MDSRSVAIAPAVARRWETAQRRSVDSQAQTVFTMTDLVVHVPISAFTSPIPVFTMTDLRVHDADPGVHDAPIRAFPCERSWRSRWTETRTGTIDVQTRGARARRNTA